MDKYLRTPHYYETDQMRVVHHSNYVRWFEEARIHYLENVGIRFAEQEEKGIVCPVLTLNTTYKIMVRYGENVEIVTRLNLYNGLRFGFLYEVRNIVTGEICCVGNSTHCFLDTEGNILRVKRDYPEMHRILTKMLAVDAKN